MSVLTHWLLRNAIKAPQCRSSASASVGPPVLEHLRGLKAFYFGKKDLMRGAGQRDQ